MLFQQNYYPTRFREHPRLYSAEHPRAPRLDLPFRREDFDGIWFPHGAEPPRQYVSLRGSRRFHALSAAIASTHGQTMAGAL